MTRIQILTLPEGAGDERPPFVLVVDEWTTRRFELDAGAPVGSLFDLWQRFAHQVGARGVMVTPETVEIPANDVSGFLAPVVQPVDEQQHLDVALMDRITDALGVDRLRDWDEIVWAIENMLSAVQAEKGVE
ncbi:hypothetical protein [Streptomyces sp. NPDC051561]|uniref:hypothetical protein n=1 Tax=Streptomyces sp. NPDC051561 TaxID=3365658 RepID=UPI00379C877E